MSNPYVGEIRMFGGSFAPQGWAFCNGQLLAITENETLFQLIGTTYGGDGQTTFALPDLRGRLPIHQGNGFVPGQRAGEETVTLTSAQLPQHGHTAQGQSGGGTQAGPGGGLWADFSGGSLYSGNAANAAMNPAAVPPTGGNQPHDNLMPYLAVSFIISLFGIFPSQ